MIGYVKFITEENRKCWVRADEIGTIVETAVFPKPGPGRPSAEAVKTIPVIALSLRNSNKVNVKGETLETVLNKMRQALGTQLLLVTTAVDEPGANVAIPAEDAA